MEIQAPNSPSWDKIQKGLEHLLKGLKTGEKDDSYFFSNKVQDDSYFFSNEVQEIYKRLFETVDRIQRVIASKETLTVPFHY